MTRLLGETSKFQGDFSNNDYNIITITINHKLFFRTVCQALTEALFVYEHM